MKRIALGMIILTLITLVVGCNNTVSELNVTETQKIIENKLKNTEVVDEELLEDVYGLDLSKMDVHIIKQNSEGDLYAIIKATDKASVKNDMKKYFEKVEKFNTNYSPERLEILSNRVEKEIGDYLIYIVSENAENIYSEILKTL